MPHSLPPLKTRMLLKYGHAIKKHLKQAVHRPIHLKMVSWPGSTHRCCCVSCSRQGCRQSRRLPLELLPGQLSAGTERSNEMGWARKSERWGEVKPHKSLWGTQHWGAISTEEVSLMGLQETLFLVMHNKDLLHREQWKPRKSSRPSLQSGVQKISALESEVKVKEQRIMPNNLLLWIK